MWILKSVFDIKIKLFLTKLWPVTLSLISWLELSSGSKISFCSRAIKKFNKKCLNLVLTKLSFYNGMHFNVFRQIFKIFLEYHTERKPVTPAPPLNRIYCSAWFDWLGVDLEVKSLCHWPTPQTENQGIEECSHSKCFSEIIKILEKFGRIKIKIIIWNRRNIIKI